MKNKESFKAPFLDLIDRLQEEICQALLQEDEKAILTEDNWIRPEGGGGKSCAISKGNVFESGGVNTSAVFGQLPADIMNYLETGFSQFFACGISLIIHPVNPFIPTVHANFRYFELYDENDEVADQWFGGGSDITPYYLFEEDVVHFHRLLKDACDPFDNELYPKFKKACDEYFYNHHRQEARGAGGLFFDRLRGTGEQDAGFWLDFVTACANAVIPSYLPIVQKRKSQEYNAANKYWQEIRRGRYVEFNLLHDKGTLFGLKTNGRIESILMSLPATVRWEYNHQPEAGSPEAKMLEILTTPKNWI